MLYSPATRARRGWISNSIVAQKNKRHPPLRSKNCYSSGAHSHQRAGKLKSLCNQLSAYVADSRVSNATSNGVARSQLATLCLTAKQCATVIANHILGVNAIVLHAVGFSSFVAAFGWSKPFLLCHVDYCRKLLSSRLDCHPACEDVSRRRCHVQDLICPFSIHSLCVKISFGMFHSS